MPTKAVWTRPERTTMMQTMPAATHSKSQQRPATHLRLQKQLSFAEAHKAQHNGNSRSDRVLLARKAESGYLRRGFSVDRSLETIREATQKSTASYDTQNKRLTKPVRAGHDPPKSLRSIEINELGCVRAGSTSSILKSLDYELKQVNTQLEQRYNCKSLCGPVNATNVTGTESVNSKLNSLPAPCEHQTNHDNSTPTLKSDCNKVNLNIVLSHVINFKKTNSNESNNSDIESYSESVEIKPKVTGLTRTLRTDLPDRARIETATSVSANALLPIAAPTPTSIITANATAHQRRAQFRSSRNLTTNTSNNAAANVPAANNVITANDQIEHTTLIPTPSNNSGAILNATPSLTVQRRPPLVRAMSAPVRSRSLDENSKSAFAFQKRKLRRRKLNTRNASVCENNDADTLLGGGGGGGRVDKNDILFDLNAISGKKTSIARTRSTLAVDVITLVSLVSSEGSDSEKEDSAPETVRGNAERSRSTGTPSLRKTGKSVSFQENYPPNFQLATKEYSHMIRRGSIVPFATRLRSNRPPTAPPVSIFMNESITSTIMPVSPTETAESNHSNNDTNAKLVADNPESPKNDTELGCETKRNEEYTYPEYVRSLKERECWKLYRKMSIKGVSVSYETVLRGMLTPTEFRQIQKQREIEEAKARALEEAKESALDLQIPTSAVDRLTQKLLKK